MCRAGFEPQADASKSVAASSKGLLEIDAPWKVTLTGKRTVLKTVVGLKTDRGSSPLPSDIWKAN